MAGRLHRDSATAVRLVAVREMEQVAERQVADTLAAAGRLAVEDRLLAEDMRTVEDSRRAVPHIPAVAAARTLAESVTDTA